MSLTLANFKKVLPQTILTRGREYYKSGNVSDLNLDDEDLWVAQVSGTEEYEVQIERHGDELITSCTCPYDLGDYCKHVAAVLYAIEDSYPEYFGGKKPRKPGKKKETRADKLQNALKQASEANLRDFLSELGMKDRNIYNQIMLKYGRGQSKEGYEKMVRDALRVGRAEYGMIDYRGAKTAAKTLREFILRADEQLEQGEPETALLMYQTVMENVIDVIPMSDDSSGELGACISLALEKLEQCAGHLSQPHRQALLTYVLNQAKRRELSGFDWRWDLLEIATDLVTTPGDRAELMKILDEIDNEGRQSFFGLVSTFNAGRTADIRLKLIERLDGEQAANAFIQANTHLPHFKALIINRHVQKGEFAEAKKLINAAIEDANKQRLPGLAANYRAGLLEIAKQEQDTPMIIKLAREFLLQRPAEEYYTLLKKTVASNEWPAFVEGLIKDTPNTYFATEFSAWLFAKEGMWDRLLGLIKSDSAWLAEHYHAELEKRFPDAMAEHYESFALYAVEGSANRDGYKKAAEYLRRMKKLGQTTRADKLISELRRTYPKRRALLEELDQV
jgi:uncharacterized Zn finger protein